MTVYNTILRIKQILTELITLYTNDKKNKKPAPERGKFMLD